MSSSAPQITFYTNKAAPYAHRVELALEESGAKYTSYQIDLMDKPEWYKPKVNSTGKVPTISYGGPVIPADEPSLESVKLAESLVLIEFVADLFPASGLLPKDPVQRARARFFIEVVTAKFPAIVTSAAAGDLTKLGHGVEAIEALLSPDSKYAVGDKYTNADIAITPFIARLLVVLKNGIGPLTKAEGLQAAEDLQAKHPKFWKYWKNLEERPSFQNTFDEARVLEVYRKFFAPKEPIV